MNDEPETMESTPVVACTRTGAFYVSSFRGAPTDIRNGYGRLYISCPDEEVAQRICAALNLEPLAADSIPQSSDTARTA